MGHFSKSESFDKTLSLETCLAVSSTIISVRPSALKINQNIGV